MLRPVPGAAQYAMPVDGLYPVRRRLPSRAAASWARRPQCRARGTRGGARGMSTRTMDRKEHFRTAV